jgi:hypothetical protein
MPLLSLILAIRATRKLAKSPATKIWEKWRKDCFLTFCIIFLIQFVLGYTRESANPFANSPLSTAAAYAIGTTVAVLGMIYLPITVIGALIGRYGKSNKVRNDSHNSHPARGSVELTPLWVNEAKPPAIPNPPIRSTSQQLVSQSTVSSTRCSECYEKLSVSENTCPNCHASQNPK